MQTNNKKVLVLGLGKSGQSVAAYLTRTGAEVIGVDRRAAELRPHLSFSVHEDVVCDGIDWVVKSPGIPAEHPWVLEAQERGLEVMGEMALACRLLQARSKTLLAITGSNGKTTTTLLTTHFLRHLGKKAIAVGNIGTPLISMIDHDAEIFVVELSSFQLEDLALPVFDAAIILNITPNHLDRYPSFEAYATAKLRLQHCLKPEGRLYVSWETLEKFRPLLKEKVETIFPLVYRERKSRLPSHEFENIRGAYTLCQKFGISEPLVWEALRTFQRPPHRLEFVRCLRGVTFVNDSKATSVDALRKAIEAQSSQVILIAGGVDKGGSYSELASAIREKVRHVLTIGEAAERIKRELSPMVSVERVKSLKSATTRAYEIANKGEIVLFSPGCSSFDMFQNFEHRGEIFKGIVDLLGEGKV
ncbi:MAG: UDP-N-acetylmuramoylalanine--D-glutamate ligase [Chlamydiae bacterium]|nr:UDP-N-acetylmuramoylalanine--D-glutamate ligase [Chlamydiota bacterium]